MNIGTYQTPENRSEFEHRLHLLAHAIEEGKFHINSGVSIEGLMMLRYLPNGRLDLLSVDESTRTLANMMLTIADMPMSEQLFEES